MILVTGAAGKTGQAIVAALGRAGAPVRALVRSSTQSELLTRLGAHEVVFADMRLPQELKSVFENIQAVYHICPNVNSDEVEIGRNVIGVAQAAGVERVVLHSVLHPQAELMPHHWHKLRVEEALLESGLNFTLLQPAPYMQNLLTSWHQISTEGLLRNPYAVETRLSLVDLEDVAAVAAMVLTKPGHTGATYELAGTLPLTQLEIAALLSRALGRTVRAEAETVEAWAARARLAGLGDQPRAILIRMFHYYEKHGLIGNPNVLRWLLGREPTTVEAFARRTANGSA